METNNSNNNNSDSRGNHSHQSFAANGGAQDGDDNSGGMSPVDNRPANSRINVTNSGIRAVLEQSLQSYDRLPMLEIICEKFIRQLSSALRNLTSEAVNITLQEIVSLRFGGYFDSIDHPVSIAVFKAVEWENFGLLIIENDLIFAFVDLLLGGKKNTIHAANHDLNKALTSIEQGIAKQMSEVVLSELGQAFDQISPTTFTFERLESNPNFVNICRPGDAIIVVKLKITIDEQVKVFELLLPYKTLEPVKEKMQQVFLGDKFGADHEWERIMYNAANDIELPIEAVIVSTHLSLHDVVKLKIGDTLVMDHPKDRDITLRSGPVNLFTGHIGRVDDKLAISLNELAEEQMQ